MKHFLKYIIAVTTILAWLLFSYAANAAPSKEYLIKAAFIYNFTKFVKWEKPNKNINICTIGKNNFDGALKQIEKRSNAKIQYKIFNNSNENNKCNIYIYGKSAKKITSEKNILTIGEGENFSNDAGIISFINKNNKVKFIINLVAAKKAGLRMNPQLLEIAYKVVR